MNSQKHNNSPKRARCQASPVTVPLSTNGKYCMKSLTGIIFACILLSGCASRDFIRQNALSPAIDMYNRNFIVAAPTLVGNYICGAPFFLISAGIDTIAPENTRSETYYKFVNGLYIVPAAFCGAITGAIFVPISFICPENPWYGNAKSNHREWACSTPKEGPYLESNSST